jgi:XTP/dITP diphosphohydrolase
LVKASRIQDKVKGVGFDTANRIRFGIRCKKSWRSCKRSTLEIRIKLSPNLETFFSMINYARFLNVNPEDALERTNKTINRFLIPRE